MITSEPNPPVRTRSIVTIAAAQLQYFPCYKSGHTQPLANGLNILGNGDATRTLNDWKRFLAKEYCRIFLLQKLRKCIELCVSFGTDVVVFPEYSIPIECLPEVSRLSVLHELTIIAGTHVVQLGPAHANEVYQEIGALLPEYLEGRAICPIFTRGRFNYVEKITGSKFDSDVGDRLPGNPIHWAPVLLEGRHGSTKAIVLVCSDYLGRNRLEVERAIELPSDPFPLKIVVACSPALGEFVSTALRQAFDERNVATVLFVNGSDRGGTKCFEDQRDQHEHLLQEKDGTYGPIDQHGPNVNECGLANGTEGIVIVRLSESTNGRRITSRQLAVCPIVHAGGIDAIVLNYRRFLRDYSAASNLSERKKCVKRHGTLLAAISEQCTHPLVQKKLEVLLNFLDKFRDIESLDAMVLGICFISQETPDLSAWQYRAIIGSLEKLEDIRRRYPSVEASALEPLIEECKRQKESLRPTELLRSDKVLRQHSEVRLSPEEILSTSGMFYAKICKEMSSGKATENAAEWIQHLLELEDVTGALAICDEVLMHRPIPAAVILAPVKDFLNHGQINTAMSVLANYLERRRSAFDSLKRQARACLRLTPKDNLMVFGYSEAVFSLLRGAAKGRGTQNNLPTVIVTECRNRSMNSEGVSCAEQIRELGYPVTFASDASVDCVFERRSGSKRIKKLFMGIKLASRHGVVNTVGSLQVALAAKRGGAEVVFCGFSSDFWTLRQWRKHAKAILEECKGGRYLDDETRRRLQTKGIDFSSTDYASDLVTWDLVSTVITDGGPMRKKDIKPFLAQLDKGHTATFTNIDTP